MNFKMNFKGKKVNRVIDGNWAEARPLGHIYPDFKGRVAQVQGGGFVILDETGWDGYEETPPSVMEGEGEFATAEAALSRIYDLCAESELVYQMSS